MAREDALDATARERLNAAVARAIRDRRRKRELTREQVYTTADLPRATYDRIEKGETLPDVGRLEAIAHALDTTAVGIINEAKRSLEETPAVDPPANREETSARAARIYGRMLGLE
ncbi:helix-turn-helix domain-containing protein [Nocardia sp. CA-128927]|uniref:helix-turn-helix domain-containing protein n=1 Tax=Nocardia sp. CA-128927 TaxID=3239975 RepID=UPI003D983EB6